MANFTYKEGSYEAIQVVSCWVSLHGNHYLYSLTALNVLLSITASLGNLLILVALRRESSLHPPSKLLFRCLTATDLLVGVFSQPVFVIQLISIAHQRLQLCYTVVSLNDIAAKSLCGVSLLTMTAINVDRLLALLLGLRYRQTVTLGRTRGFVVGIWILSISISILNRFLTKHTITSKVYSATIYSLLLISVFCYTKIFLRLRQPQAQIQNSAHQERLNGGGGRIALNVKRYRKTVSTALWVQLTLVACYLPFGIVSAIVHPYSPPHNIAVRLTMTLIYFNSSLNPFLYCWKIRGVRKAVKDIIGWLGLSRNNLNIIM